MGDAVLLLNVFRELLPYNFLFRFVFVFGFKDLLALLELVL